MTGRSVPAWRGATPDTPAPQRVRLRVFDRAGGCCHRCARKIGAGEGWTLEHLQALCNGGENAEPNLGVTCDWCLPEKNAEDVAIKSKDRRRRAKHVGAAQKRSSFATARGGKWKQKIGGQIVPREDG